MEITFLGTGTSQGVPMIACACSVCTSTDPRNRRSRTSIHVVMDGHHIQVDAAPEFREQCLRHKISRVDTFVLTHPHADHVLGMDDLRRFCDMRDGAALPVFSSPEGLSRIRQIYPYAISDRPAVRGYPAFALQPMPHRLALPGGTLDSILLPHGSMPVLGLVFTEQSTGTKLTYYTDCKEVGPEARSLATDSGAVVLGALRHDPHPTHMSIGEALAVASAIGSPLTYLTHFTHAVDHLSTESTLPPSVRLAYDGLRLTLP